MMKDYFKEMRFYWLFIVSLAFTYLLLLFHYNHWLLLILLIIIYRILRLKHLPTLITAFGMGLLISWAYSIQVGGITNIEELPLDGEEYILQIESDPLNIKLDEDRLSGQGQASLFLNGELIEIQVDYVQWLDKEKVFNHSLVEKPIWKVKAIFNRPEPARNFNVFDYQAYLKTQKIMWQVEIQEIQAIQAAKSIDQHLKKFRYHLLKRFIQENRHEWASLHNKLLFNLDSEYYKNIKDDFLSLGVAHYFAISGFHIYFIRKLLKYILLRMGLTVEITDKLVTMILFVYLWLVRWPVGVIRVLFMQLLDRLFNWINIPLTPIDRLSLSALILLILHPFYALSLGFCLSYLLTLVVILFEQADVETNAFINSFELTLACLLFSWPIIMQTSFEWNVGQLLFILLFSIIFDKIIMPLIFATTIGIIFKPFGYEWAMNLLNQMLLVFEGWNESTKVMNLFNIHIGYLNVPSFALLILTAILFIIVIQKNRFQAYIIIITVYIFYIVILPYMNLQTSITLIDVGQGDAILYSLPFNQGHWLIDTGGKANWATGQVGVIDENFADKNIVPALKALGVNKLQAIILTHPDIDHIGNLIRLTEVFAVKELWISEYTEQSPIWRQIKDSLQTNKVRVLVNGKEYRAHKASIRIFSISDSSLAFSSTESNDRSLIAQLTLGELQFLSLGDISKAIEIKMINEKTHLDADIIKLGHHGSDTSTSEELLLHYHPQLAVNSAGLNNRYGHPHQSVLKSLQENNIPLLSTHECGAIRITYHPLWGYQIETVIQ